MQKLNFVFLFIISVSILLVSIDIMNLSINESLSLEEYSIKTNSSLRSKFSSVLFNGNSNFSVLLIHGYSSSPYEFLPLMQTFVKNNISFYAPLLKGHGSSPRDLLKISEKTWYDNIFSSYNFLKKRNKNIDVIGSSLGAPLALNLASEKTVNKLILLNPFFGIPKSIFYFAPSFEANLLKYFIPFFRKEQIGSINNPEGLKNYFSYKHYPMQNIPIILEIANQGISYSKSINNPILMIFSNGDKVADLSKNNLVFNNLASKNKELLIYNKSNHVLLYDYDSNDIIKNILIFLRS